MADFINMQRAFKKSIRERQMTYRKMGKEDEQAVHRKNHEWTINMKKSTISHIIKETQIKTLMRCHLPPIRMV